MRIAVPYENGQVFPHFGHSKQFKLYEVEAGKISWSMVISTDEKGPNGLVAFLKQAGAQLLLCGGIGGGAIAALQKNGILLQGGVIGDADVRVQEFLEGRLQAAPLNPCHHHHGEGCGHHDGCGEHDDCSEHDCGCH